MKPRFPLLMIICAALMCGCAAEPVPAKSGTESTTFTQTEASTAPETQATETVPADPLDTLLSGMTLRQKVGQLFIVRPDALQSDGSSPTQLTDAMLAVLADYPVGGIAMFGQNIVSPDQIISFNGALQNASDIPMFLCVDEEGGIVARLANHRAFDLPRYKSAASVGSSGDPADALAMGSTIGAYLSQYGFNLDFAPVADVNTNPDNPVIGTRAFSSDAATAAEMASAMAQGLRSQGIIAVFKHFPGHGDTAEDSHAGIAVSYKSEAEMRECEWLPFLEASSEDFVMVGHVAVPEITGDLTPATMSHQVVTEILKEELGFRGLVVTDAMEMGAITDTYTSAEAAVLALQAGCDILLMPENLQEAFDGVVAAVEDGTLSMEWLDETVRRILECKQANGILDIQ